MDTIFRKIYLNLIMTDKTVFFIDKNMDILFFAKKIKNLIMTTLGC